LSTRIVVQCSQGNENGVLTFNPIHFSFARETVLNKPGEITMKDEVQSQFQLYFFITLLTLFLLSFSARAQINAGSNLDNVEISFVVAKLQNKLQNFIIRHINLPITEKNKSWQMIRTSR
jgi:hypothetical protein